jgi:hypothetical protein
LATTCAPIVVLPPGRFSTTTPTFQSWLIFCAMIRASTSVGPPGGNGTTMWIGRLGKSFAASCAAAAPRSNTIAAMSAVSLDAMIKALLPAWAIRVSASVTQS